MQPDLFAQEKRVVTLGPGAALLEGFAAPGAERILSDMVAVAEKAPFRHMETPGGWRMSVAMTNCGALGWTTSRRGYRYTTEDPETGKRWPGMPESFRALAQAAASEAGSPEFEPDACLINRYEAGARLSLHQDRNEIDMEAPIVSVSLGLRATFLWGGNERSDRPRRIALHHGDVVVWGGPSRLVFHGVDTLSPGDDPLTGAVRFNLTFRRAGS